VFTGRSVAGVNDHVVVASDGVLDGAVLEPLEEIPMLTLLNPNMDDNFSRSMT
jgi:hypothetical protein